MAPLVTRRACDACRKRKVKCDGLQPCLTCREAELICLYHQRPRKKGRQGETANVLTALRTAQQSHQPQQHATETDEYTEGSQLSPSNRFLQPQRNHGRTATPLLSPQRWPKAPQSPPTPRILSLDLMSACTDFYLAHLQTTVPILDRLTLEEEMIFMNQSLQSYCFMVAFCAYVIISTGGAIANEYTTLSGAPLTVTIAQGRELVDEAIEARRYIDDATPPSTRSVLICFFLYGCYVGMGNQRRAWFFLREATTFYSVGPLHVEPGVKIHQSIISNRLFWLLLVSERSHSIRRRRPITLQVTPESPPIDDDCQPPSSFAEPSTPSTISTPTAAAAAAAATTTPTKTTSFVHLIRLFRPFDESFFALWNRSQTLCTETFLTSLETQVQDAVPAILPPHISSDEIANLRVSQQWLRIMLWELFTLLGFLSSTSPHECLTFRHPLVIARDLTFATWKLPHRSMEIHGVGLTEKIFDVACAVTDILSYIPSTRTVSSGIELGPEDYLKHFCSLMSQLPGGQTKFVPLLMAKMGQLLPAMLKPMALHLKLPVPSEDEAHVLTPDSAVMYDEEVRKQLNVELSRIGMETLERTEEG